MLAKGTTAPDFSLYNSDNELIRLSDYKGKKNIVLYFYPKDDTPGCTLEAQGFSDNKEQYDKLDAIVLGVSKDTVRSHQKFCKKYGLVITLLADPDHQVIESYEAWQLKKMMGREFMGIVRSTYLIDKNGIIQAVWPEVTVEGHEHDVLNALASL